MKRETEITKRPNETGIMYEYRKMMHDLGITIYQNNPNQF